MSINWVSTKLAMSVAHYLVIQDIRQIAPGLCKPGGASWSALNYNDLATSANRQNSAIPGIGHRH
jgi:hypothetical protein